MSSSRRRRWPRGRQGDQQDSASTPGGDSGQDDAFHLPGFYYDASQRRYFRLMPGQNGHNPLTLASIEAKLSDKNCRRVVESSLRRSGNTALPQSLSRMQMGLLPVDSFVASVQRVRMASLRGTLQAQIEDGGECTFLSGFCESGSTVVVGAWALETEGGRRVSVLRCVDVGNPTKPGLQTLASQPLHKVVDISVYRRRDGRVGTCCACVASDCMSFVNSFVMLQSVGDGGPVSVLPFGADTLHSCTSSTGGQAHAVGLERKAQVLQRQETGFLPSSVWTCHESPLAVEFCEDGKLLFVGTHRGNVICSDLRDQPHSKCAYMIPLGRGVVSLKAIDSGYMLLASAYDGKLVLVDLRNRHVVQKFNGHCNNGLKIPLSYNASERILCSAGHDRVVRLWRLGHQEPLTALKPGSGLYQPWPWYSTRLFCAAGGQCFTFS